MAKTCTGRFITRVSFIFRRKKNFIFLIFSKFSRDLAIAIHNDERRQYHQAQLQQQQQQRYSQGYYYEKAPKQSKKKHNRSSYDDEHDSGCILS